MAPGQLETLVRQLMQRGWYVTAAEKAESTLLIGFNFMPGGGTSWLKAFEVPHADATVEGVEHAIETWKAKVRNDIANATASDLVRRMIAEHGPDRVGEAMNARLLV